MGQYALKPLSLGRAAEQTVPNFQRPFRNNMQIRFNKEIKREGDRALTRILDRHDSVFDLATFNC